MLEKCALTILELNWNQRLGHKGLAKLGNIVADANVSQFSLAGNVCRGYKFCCSETNNVFAMESKTFLLRGHKFCV